MDADPDPAYHFFADPDFYLMRMRIQVTKMMRIRIHNAAFDDFFFFSWREKMYWGVGGGNSVNKKDR